MRTPGGIFEKMTSFTQIVNQDYGTRKINGRHINILGNKGPKNVHSNIRKRLKLGKISRKDLLCMKM